MYLMSTLFSVLESSFDAHVFCPPHRLGGRLLQLSRLRIQYLARVFVELGQRHFCMKIVKLNFVIPSLRILQAIEYPFATRPPKYSSKELAVHTVPRILHCFFSPFYASLALSLLSLYAHLISLSAPTCGR